REPATLLCVARAADPNKGVGVLLEAVARLATPARLVLVDEDHPLHPARQHAARLGLGERLEITGRLPAAELVRRYRSATLVVVPSLYEGFGLPAAEAMACGTPVVATAAGALPEVMRTGGGGTVVAKGDPAALARAIDELLAQPARRAQLGKEARARIVE